MIHNGREIPVLCFLDRAKELNVWLFNLNSIEEAKAPNSALDVH